jgi:hypothetical protein
MIQRFFYVGAKEAYLTIDHNNHVYNYYTKWEDADTSLDYIAVPLRAIGEILEDIKNAGYTESTYRIE